ncbi:hypothetical protein [Agarivorans sp. 1_MG-2023]|uniref:hypothetical protein n=1 Tax=Agarivorans sp. 1_MG-2023 TaxID=3062634 RepID=UPI0026E206EC|nr:hypothetical protein [Agarivorans sp. 1_MG-2023]MDO6762572.1 hypothetical protein [Agarivorans sp. 1_MG-2023]
MEKILTNLNDPAWWFTGVFFGLLLKFAPMAFLHLRMRAGKGLRKFFRGRRYKYKRFLKESRHNIAAVNHQTAKSHAYFQMFVITCALYLVWYVAGPLFQIQKASLILFLICLLPMYTVQVYWMLQEGRAKDLVAEYGKVRITNKSY